MTETAKKIFEISEAILNERTFRTNKFTVELKIASSDLSEIPDQNVPKVTEIVSDVETEWLKRYCDNKPYLSVETFSYNYSSQIIAISFR